MCLLVSHSVSVSESRSPPFGSRWARGVRSQPRRPSPCQQPLDLPKEGAPGLFLFSPWPPFPCPLLRCQGRPSLQRPPPFLLPPLPSPAGEGGAVSVPAQGPGWTGRRCDVCVCYRGQHTALSGNQRVLSLGVGSGGQRQRIRARVRAAAAAEAAAAAGRPHLLAGCRGNGRRRGPSSPRRSKQDGWARAGVIKDETGIRLRQR